MTANKTNAVMIGEKDIQDLLAEWQNVPNWIKLHVSARYPAHRYEGQLQMNEDGLSFCGRDIKEGAPFQLNVPLASITEVRVGFSDRVMTSMDPAFGTGGPVPVAVSYRENGGTETLYFNTLADNHPAHINVNNIRWYEALDSLLAGNQRQPLAAGRKRQLAAAW